MEVKSEIRRAKQRYKAKIEQKLSNNNLSSAWDGMKTITGAQHWRVWDVTNNWPMFLIRFIEVL